MEVDNLSENFIQNEYLLTEGNELNESDDVLEEREMKDRSKLCYVCDNEEIDLFFDCGNGVCEECIIEHTKEQLNKYKIKVLSDKVQFVCPGSCKCNVENKIIEKFMNQETQKIYEEVLLKMYLSKTEDIISCPRSECNYYGLKQENSFLGLNFMNNKKCYECDLCKNKWTENEGGLEMFFSPKNLLNQFSLSNIKSQIMKYMITKYCNKCNAPIEKADGCKHIECNRCDYSFCWRCTGDWKGHVEFSCMGLLSNEYEETIRPNFSKVLIWYLFFIILLKFTFTFNIVLYILELLLKSALYIAFLFLDGVFLYASYFNYKRKTLDRKEYRAFGIFLIILNIILYSFQLHPFSEKYYFYSEILSLIGISLCILIRPPKT